MHRFKVSIVVQLRIQVFCLGHDSVIRSTSAWTPLPDPCRQVNQSYKMLETTQHHIPENLREPHHFYGRPYLITHPKHVNCQVFQIKTVRVCRQLAQCTAILSRKVWKVPLILASAPPQGTRLYTAQFYDDAANHILTIQEDRHVEQISKWDVQVILKQAFQVSKLLFLTEKPFVRILRIVKWVD